MKGSKMQIDGDLFQWVVGGLGAIIAWLGKISLHNRSAIEKHTRFVAENYPTRTEIDKKFDSHKDDLKYIRAKVDKIVDKMIDK
jgi:hypothetical protein